MYAVVDIKGFQYKCEAGKSLVIPRVAEAEVGDKIVFENVLLISENGAAQVGQPTVKGAKVETTVIAHGKGDKVIHYRKYRRKGFQKKKGHRQPFTEVEVTAITK
ncbi:50S ribosomal protein L21 [bacterium]|nr:50S ribosomal protein L21 [bacterium]NUN47165.1 50S ribosomal protein L21 [bacterium]HMW32491.1 50S ribosomal protein L21 [bacterium]HMW35254.1 50S ribosomal protein L21 [bacterium]HMY36762.1 50S ribosomal protein L21 [bacterium]